MFRRSAALFALATLLGPLPTRGADSNAGSITGTVTFAGQAPARKDLETKTDAQCHGPQIDQSTLVGPGNRVPWAFLYIAQGLEGQFTPPVAPVIIDQTNCRFEPHVCGLMPGQPLRIANSDPVFHNTRAIPQVPGNTGFNDASMPGTPPRDHTFTKPEAAIPLKCDIHQWMKAFAWVVPHPFFAVSDQDGNFEIKNVPPGNYGVAIWHETFKGKGKLVQVKAGEKAKLEFTVAQ